MSSCDTPPTWAEMQTLLSQMDWRDQILTLTSMPKPQPRCVEHALQSLLMVHAKELVLTHKRVLP